MSFSPFADGSPVATIPAKDVVAWTRKKEEGRLLLPPIQRSLVWRNSQILNYWDSLLRGYPAGLMMAHRCRFSGSGVSQARTSDGRTCVTTSEDFQLFDGQQRLSALLLGHGEGQLASKLRLWVDLGADVARSSGHLFRLRISSRGQPFGYQSSSPNQKLPLGERRLHIEEWMRKHGLSSFDPRDAFEVVRGSDLLGCSDAEAVFPLVEAIDLLDSGCDHAKGQLQKNYPKISEARLEAFLKALDGALKQLILFQRIDESVLAEESEYIRFFGRLGQGGTPLSENELTYSIIKHHYPEVHDRMAEVMHGQAGRLAGEVHLVMATIRLAKVRSGWRPENIWEVIGRPTPNFVSRLKELREVDAAFRGLIDGELVVLLEQIRQRLVYDPERNPQGLPVMLLARMPHSLIDVLLLLIDLPASASGRDPLPAFALYWLLFVIDHEKTAALVYRRFIEAQPEDLTSALPLWIEQFEKDGIAHAIPHLAQLPGLDDDVPQDTHRLRAWAERFVSLDVNAARPVGQSLRVLSTNHELIKRALLWLQRRQLSEFYPHFDPTSAEDEDLPIDLDHRMPQSIFGFDWRESGKRLAFEDRDENFRHRRKLLGHSLGNLRWLDASENRSRGNGDLESDELLQDVNPWNELRKKARWDEKDVATFQRLIDGQSVVLCRNLLDEGGICRLRNGGQEEGSKVAPMAELLVSGTLN